VNSWVDLHALWQIAVIGVIAGAGLPALFAVGLRALNVGADNRVDAATSDTATDQIIGGSPIGIAAATVCFAVVLAGIGWGIYFIVAGS
jgi:hypothetical protein